MIEVEMTSLEIAELTGKNHKRVLQDVRDKLLPKIDGHGIGRIFKYKDSIYLDKYGREKPMFILNKYAANAFMANYKLEHAMLVVEHLHNLENQVLKQQEELDIMKNIVWTVINGQNWVNQNQALKMAGIKHPNLFMKYLKQNVDYFDKIVYDKGYLANKRVGKSGLDMCWRFSKEGFKWLLDKREEMNMWVDKIKLEKRV